MKTKFRIPVMFMMAAMLCAVVIVSCKDDSDDNNTPAPETVDLTKLQASITAAQTALTSTTEGKADGQYSSDSRATLTAAIGAAQAVVGNSATTQEQADNAKNSLDLAVTAYNDSVIKPIAVEDLVAYWSFDEGTGTTVADGTANHFDGELKAGGEEVGSDNTKWKSAVPTWTADRTGAEGKALNFAGGNVEIPYNVKLNPSDAMSVSVWVKPDALKDGNRFLGLQSWIGYKFEIQGGGFPFFSMGHGEAGAAYDRDTNPFALETSEFKWHHLVVTFSSADSKMLFYVDGDLVKEWDDTPEAGHVLVTPYNITIGQDFPTDKYCTCNGDNFGDNTSDEYQVIPAAWGGFYEGSLDEMRMYKVALTASQVTSLYDREKPEEQ